MPFMSSAFSFIYAHGQSCDRYAAGAVSHPMALLRKKLDKYNLKKSGELRQIPDGRTVRTAGIVMLMPQPDTAKRNDLCVVRR